MGGLVRSVCPFGPISGTSFFRKRDRWCEETALTLEAGPESGLLGLRLHPHNLMIEFHLTTDQEVRMRQMHKMSDSWQWDISAENRPEIIAIFNFNPQLPRNLIFIFTGCFGTPSIQNYPFTTRHANPGNPPSEKEIPFAEPILKTCVAFWGAFLSTGTAPGIGCGK